MKDFIDAVKIDQATEGRKELMWTDPGKFPGLVDAAMVRGHLDLNGPKLINSQLLQTVEAELAEELRTSEFSL